MAKIQYSPFSEGFQFFPSSDSSDDEMPELMEDPRCPASRRLMKELMEVFGGPKGGDVNDNEKETNNQKEIDKVTQQLMKMEIEQRKT